VELEQPAQESDHQEQVLLTMRQPLRGSLGIVESR
jgi:hypothetical protein